MDKHAVELSKAGLRLLESETGREISEVEARIIGYLAAHKATVEDLRLQEVNDRANIKLLTEFSGLLPEAEHTGRNWVLSTEAPYTVKVFQSNMVWLSEHAYISTHSYTDNGVTKTNTFPRFANRPYCIIGRRGQGRKTRLLLACVGSNDTEKKRTASDRYGQVFKIAPTRRSRKTLSRMRETMGSDYPSPDIMQELFDPETGMLEIDGMSPGSSRISAKGGTYDYGFVPLERISDTDMALFDVNSNLHRIANEFRITERLAVLLDHHTVQLPNSNL